MSNPYTPNTPLLIPGDVARAEDLNAKFAAQDEGWNRLPAPHPSLKGFNEPVVVGTPALPGHATPRLWVETAMSSQVAQAAASATAAANSATAALASQTAAAASATSASNSQTAAANSAAAALASQNAAASSASGASASAASAGTSATNAANSATAASNSATAAAGSASTASAAASSASASATAASGSATSAASSASGATSSANSAAASAGNASTSAGAAATSATNAAASASSASASASSASASATTATNQATAATSARNLAEQWASNPEDVAVSGGLFSARHYAIKAAASAAAAAGGGVALTGDQSIAGVKTFTQSVPLDNLSYQTAPVALLSPGGAGNETRFPGIGFHKASTFGNFLYSANTLDLRMRDANGGTAVFWSNFNHGAGSGLNADLLDGVQGASYARLDQSNTFTTINTFGAQQRFLAQTVPIASSSGDLAGLEARANGAGAAFMAFHRPSSFAGYFGLDTDNQWKIGGWSYGAQAFRVWHEGVFALPVAANTANAPVRRDASGNFSAGTITANLQGNADTASLAAAATEAANAAALAGFSQSASALANTIARRDGNGWLYAGYFNQSSANNENPPVSQVWVSNGSDGFLRKASIAHLTASLSGTAPISISGNAATASSAGSATNATNLNGGSVNATSGTFSDKVVVNDGAYTTRTDLGSGLTTITPNGNSSNVQSAAVASNASVALPTNVADGQTMVVRIQNTGGATVTITFNASYRMPSSVKAFSLNASQFLLFSVTNVGGTYFATASSNLN